MSKGRNEADVAFIEALAELLARNELHEIAVKREYGEADRLNVRIIRSAPAPAPAPPAALPAPAPAPATPGQPPAPAPAPATDDPAQHPGAVTSPMVGIAYLAPEPGAQAFVGVGSQVVEGQTLLIIEAMKTMNHIPSPRAGTVKRILVSNETPVEYGAPLMIIE